MGMGDSRWISKLTGWRHDYRLDTNGVQSVERIIQIVFEQPASSNASAGLFFVLQCKGMPPDAIRPR